MVKEAHSLNAEGPFYVENGCCLICDLPRQVAPDMFKYHEAEMHCYVYQQPQTEEQLTRMVEVMKGADLACVRCRSRDGQLLRRLIEAGLKNECDFPPEIR